MPNVSMLMYLFGVYHMVGGLEHEIYDFPFSLECHHQLTFTPSFFRGVGRKTTNQSCLSPSHDGILVLKYTPLASDRGEDLEDLGTHGWVRVCIRPMIEVSLISITLLCFLHLEI